MPEYEAPCLELGSAPRTPSVVGSPTPSPSVSSTSSTEPPNIQATPLFRALAMPPPEPDQPPGQEELERRLPGYRRIVIPRELTLIELLKQCSGVSSDEEVLHIREAQLRVVAERVGLRRLHVLAPRLHALTLDGSALASLRDLGIGLVHLKYLSINRCGLTCLDGVWGLGALRELHAAGNKVQDLQSLAALQKLHTLNLAENPIEDIGRLWMIAICGSLRRLTLRGTPVADEPTYRAEVIACLPSITHLDDRPVIEDTDDMEGVFGPPSSSSDSEPDEEPQEAAAQPPDPEPEAGPSTTEESVDEWVPDSTGPAPARRPATTEGAGRRPARAAARVRPRTAGAGAQPVPTLLAMNTLMDEEWRCSGSRLTSLGAGAACGNIAQALRRRRHAEERELMEQTMADVSRALAAEIPKVPLLQEWERFRKDTGIEIHIDFTARPKCTDPSSAIDRLERIERETLERFGLGDGEGSGSFNRPVVNDLDVWQRLDVQTAVDVRSVDELFNDTVLNGGIRARYASHEDTHFDC